MAVWVLLGFWADQYVLSSWTDGVASNMSMAQMWRWSACRVSHLKERWNKRPHTLEVEVRISGTWRPRALMTDLPKEVAQRLRDDGPPISDAGSAILHQRKRIRKGRKLAHQRRL